MRRWIDARCFETMVKDLQKITGEHVELAYVDQGYTDAAAAEAIAEHASNLK